MIRAAVRGVAVSSGCRALIQFLVYYSSQNFLRSRVVSDPKKIEKTEQQWRQELDSETYRVTRQAGTEAAFSGKYCDLKDKGIYNCAACGEPLFSSDTKYDSGSGWPSFWEPVSEDNIEYISDTEYGMLRTEVNCKKCGSHLGHVFDDGPKPTNQRYCINSISLKHEKDE